MGAHAVTRRLAVRLSFSRDVSEWHGQPLGCGSASQGVFGRRRVHFAAKRLAPRGRFACHRLWRFALIK